MGRKATPHELKILNGNPGKRPMNPSPPKPVGKIGKPPRFLDERGVYWWNEFLKEWALNGLDVSTYAPLLGTLANTMALYEKAAEDLKEHGAYNTHPRTGIRAKHPALTDMIHMATVIKQLCSEAGVTPSSAAKIVTPAGQEASDPLSRLGIA